jgi:hypothetical protein
VRGEGDGPVVAITRDVAEGDVDGHAGGGGIFELQESIPHAKRGSGDENGTGGGIADWGFRIADCGLRIADCGLRIAERGRTGTWKFEGRT